MSSFFFKFLQIFFQNPIFKAIRVIQLLLAIIIFFSFALMPASNAPSTIHPATLHFIGNVLLITSIWVALAEYLTLRKIFLLAIILSTSSEFAQSFTASRITDLMDFCVNAIGLFFGAWLCVIGNRILKAKNIIATS